MCDGSNPLSHPASGMARHSNPQAGAVNQKVAARLSDVCAAMNSRPLALLLSVAAAAADRSSSRPLLLVRGGASSSYPGAGYVPPQRSYPGGGYQFARPAVRRQFLARVYSTVLVQVLLLAAIMAALRGAPAVAYRLMPSAPAFLLLATAPALAIQFAPRLAETPPYGHLLLAAFTALTGVGIGAATMPLPADLLALFGGPIVATARAYLGYLVYDTQLIAGGGKRFQLRPTQHVLGALMVFNDVINLFLTILQAMARADRD
ncbi:hypothetical protein EMIHUDRAFT_247161 [Emiliania huxleyi CCMP1516]|uniref:Uncharacterized protein n=2 Tax=Emiliania huxleyi TaxID=2903 RepID=A0A0D3IP47_EMIH1|nr:hypothetical protein EMIHUDRAFT_247161 [Emiliania huxleyi CCMP1516]EOD13032.1 hypothetical protein EMIHUDRAFT_247161 [Emiliania huxleyi CCMP1516]|eukprot:XP_005765461.1 hypothetical protein EMIHUDRAFT_247161 [Emiliania huxleyi CCMP1516]